MDMHVCMYILSVKLEVPYKELNLCMGDSSQAPALWHSIGFVKFALTYRVPYKDESIVQELKLGVI